MTPALFLKASCYWHLNEAGLDLSLCGLCNVLPVSAWIPSQCSDLFPNPKTCELLGNSKMPTGVNCSLDRMNPTTCSVQPTNDKPS